jgi:hypothetical protein
MSADEHFARQEVMGRRVVLHNAKVSLDQAIADVKALAVLCDLPPYRELMTDVHGLQVFLEDGAEQLKRIEAGIKDQEAKR